MGADEPDQLIGRRILEFVHPDDREITGQGAPDESLRLIERRLVRLDGHVIATIAFVLPILFEGRPATQVVVRDVSALKLAEEGLRASQEKFRLLSEGVRDSAIIMLDPLGVVISWNAGAERLTGFRTDQAVRMNIAAFFTDEDRQNGDSERILQEAIRNGRTEAEHWYVRKDGSRFWAAETITALYGTAGSVVGFARVVRDLTERREVEAALRRSEDHLRQAQKMEGIGRLAGGIAHDFNNLLTAIQGHAQFLLEDLISDHPSRGDAEEIKRSADRAAILTRQLLAFSRKQVLQPQVLDLNAIIRDMNRMLRRVIREDIALVTDLATGAWPVFADAGQIEQVLMNLVVNARDAMPDGGVLTVETRNVEVGEGFMGSGGVIKAGRYVAIIVSDTGIGMDADTQSRIFEPFFTTKPEGQGTGLGLATVYGIIRQSGGNVSVYSEPGRGTTFKALLPRADEDAAATEQKPAPTEMAHGWESVLVVEDDPAVRSMTSKVLTDRGYSVLEAESGDEAIRLAREYDGPIDLVLTDIVMPRMSGRKLAESVRIMHPSARVLFMSGYTESDVVRRGLIDPDAPFVEKPFSPERLAGSVRSALDQ